MTEDNTEYHPTTVDCLGDFVKGYDMFGHQIGFNFERKGDSHNTIIGGTFSMLIKVFMIAYITICFKRLLLNERDTNTTSFGANAL